MTRSQTILGKGSHPSFKRNDERSIRFVQNPNEGMIYLIPLRKGCPQMSRHIGIAPCNESKRGIGSVKSDPCSPPALAYSVGYFPQIFPTFFKKGCTNAKR